MKFLLRMLWRRKPWLRRLSLAGLFTGSLLVSLTVLFLVWSRDLESRGFGWLEVSSLTGLEEDVLTELDESPFIKEVWPMGSAGFKVQASLGFGPTTYATELFLEAVDSRALDQPIPEFTWTPGQTVVPLVVSRQFLGLYNLGFAPARGLPPLYASSLETLPLNFQFSGAGGRWEIQGKIVGLSDRFSTILVPWEFLEEGNRVLARGEAGKVRRAALSVTDSGDPRLISFFRERDLEVSGGAGRASEYVRLAQLFSLAMGALGILVLVLSLGLSAASLELIREQGRRELSILLQYGAEPEKIVWIWENFFYQSLGLLAVLWTLGALVFRGVVQPLTSTLGLGEMGWWMAFLAGLMVWGLGALVVHLTLVRGFSPGSSPRS